MPETVHHPVAATVHTHEYPHVISHRPDHYAVDTHVAAHTGNVLTTGCNGGYGYGGLGYGGYGYGRHGYGGCGYGHRTVHHVHHVRQPCRAVHVLHNTHHGCGHAIGIGHHGAYVESKDKNVEKKETETPATNQEE